MALPPGNNRNKENIPNRQDPQNPRQRPQRSSGMWWWLILMLFIGMWFLLQQSLVQGPKISYSRFKEELKSGNVKRVVAKGESLRGELKEPITLQRDAATTPGKTVQVAEFQTTLPPFGDEKLTELIEKQDVELISRGSEGMGMWLLVANALPILILIGLGYLIYRGISSQAGNMMSVGRSRAKKFEKERTSVTFDDVAGLEETKEELREITSFLTEPQRYARMGCRVPKGVLLVGPPGTGKTLLARAVAGEASVPFFSITGSDFMEMFVGVGASRVRDLFRTARRHQPCIIFLDELDSIGRHRGAGLGGGHDEREQTLNQLLAEIDGFEPTENIVVIAATNRPDILDPALLRPGRFDRRVTVNLPTLQEREAILKVHTKKVPLADDVDLKEIARSMPMRSGADLGNLVNEAALTAARHRKQKVDMEDFSQARDKILMGQLRGSVVLRGNEKRAVAVHEAGHALVAHLTPEADPVKKISIIPRGRGLGATQQLPEERYNLNVEYLRGRIKVMLGGRAAEELVIGTVSTGAADDLTQATGLARRMIGQWGMGEKFRNVAFDQDGSEVFLGEQLTQRREYSEATAREIDEEIKALIDSCYRETMDVLMKNSDRLDALSRILEEEESLEGKRLKEALDGQAEAPESAEDDEEPSSEQEKEDSETVSRK